jgi:hypothetical protein
MGLFTRKKQKPIYPSQVAAAERIARGILSAQRRSAVWLNTRASKLGRKKVLIMLVCLGLGFGLWCLYLVLSPLI